MSGARFFPCVSGVQVYAEDFFWALKSTSITDYCILTLGYLDPLGSSWMGSFKSEGFGDLSKFGRS